MSGERTVKTAAAEGVGFRTRYKRFPQVGVFRRRHSATRRPPYYAD
jgi:hypothetical protein